MWPIMPLAYAVSRRSLGNSTWAWDQNPVLRASLQCNEVSKVFIAHCLSSGRLGYQTQRHWCLPQTAAKDVDEQVCHVRESIVILLLKFFSRLLERVFAYSQQ
ncbi:MAG: hypothetical protein GFH27_549301n107 [Chloroflexi bacterium AL-W]|nr:hypothetical protein [Chloroflexi bacterium AL-N1]NOK68300.1 hypothetical protein [Chloroflexi bacterium AL-N10]NOK73946.1 hypothetical protein [Chloroflexi bacterium AL-N5]NOK82914.1 hypothetical protein [Chloroflexi bacterium AL-W]NOK90436.1 hypothetical protein [Chloroflexi bacterium AL-N15]